mgnify:CR=1 FL=1
MAFNTVAAGATIGLDLWLLKPAGGTVDFGSIQGGLGTARLPLPEFVAGFVELSHGNFDISQWPPLGGGQKLKLRGTVGTKRRDIELSFVEPWISTIGARSGLSIPWTW